MTLKKCFGYNKMCTNPPIHPPTEKVPALDVTHIGGQSLGRNIILRPSCYKAKFRHMSLTYAFKLALTAEPYSVSVMLIFHILNLL